MVRLVLSMLVSLVLPPFLLHRLPAPAYNAWVLIMSLSAYVGLLDFGLQTAIGKFVAEHHAADDREANHKLVSTSYTILSIAAVLGAMGMLILASQVPRFFPDLPKTLVSPVRTGVLLVSFSAAFALPFSAFTAVFTGLQRYAFPTVVAIVARVSSAVALIVLILLHGGLVQMAMIMAAFNIVSALAQFAGWHRYAKQHIQFSFLYFDRPSAVRLMKYGSVLTLWTLALLLISGLDTVIVARYDFVNTGFYGIASSATNTLLVLIASLFGPLLPALSAMQAGTTPERMGELCTRTTRYCTLLLCLFGLPLVLAAYPLLSMWVGRADAARCTTYLQVLVVGNVIRQLAYPYVLGVIATGRQYLASASAIAEAAVNVSLSIWLVKHMGAIGVAYGTLAGAIISVAVHLLVSIPRTQAVLSLPRARFILQGLLRPLAVALPSLLLLPFWKNLTLVPAPPVVIGIWLVTTVSLAWWLVLTPADRLEATAAITFLQRRPQS